MAEQVNVPAPAPAKAKAKKKGGCLRGCLIFLMVLLILVGVAAALIFNVPRKLGWTKPAGAKYTEQTHERISAEEIVAEAEVNGFKSEGVEVYVFPKPDSGDAVLYIVYDFSTDAKLTDTGAYHPVVNAFVLLGGGEKAKEYAITHVGAEFHDEEGNLIMQAAASTDDIRELQEGKITEETFREERMGTDFDVPNYFQRAVIPL